MIITWVCRCRSSIDETNQHTEHRWDSLLKAGFPTYCGNTLECRRKYFLVAARPSPKSTRPVAYAAYATLLIWQWWNSDKRQMLRNFHRISLQSNWTVKTKPLKRKWHVSSLKQNAQIADHYPISVFICHIRQQDWQMTEYIQLHMIT